jgi:hypothetical protein
MNIDAMIEVQKQNKTKQKRNVKGEGVWHIDPFQAPGITILKCLAFVFGFNVYSESTF